MQTIKDFFRKRLRLMQWMMNSGMIAAMYSPALFVRGASSWPQSLDTYFVFTIPTVVLYAADACLLRPEGASSNRINNRFHILFVIPLALYLLFGFCVPGGKQVVFQNPALLIVVSLVCFATAMFGRKWILQPAPQQTGDPSGKRESRCSRRS